MKVVFIIEYAIIDKCSVFECDVTDINGWMVIKKIANEKN